MPPKTATCLICEKVVGKSETLAWKDGRACRAHPEVLAAAEERHRAEQERLARAVEAPHRNRVSMLLDAEVESRRAAHLAEMTAWRDHVYSHCWVCDREGTPLQIYMLKTLVAMKRLEIRGEWNFWTLGEDVKRLLPGEIPLAMLPSKDEVIDKAVVKHVKDRKLRDIVHFLRMVHLCPDCAKRHGFAKRWDELLPRPTLEEIEAILPVQMLLEPAIRALAEKKEQQS